jgi:hypothetical protein
MIQDCYSSCFQLLSFEESHTQTQFCKLYPFAIIYKGLKLWQNELARPQINFSYHCSISFASLQSATLLLHYLLQLDVCIWSEQSKTIENKCHPLGDRIEVGYPIHHKINITCHYTQKFANHGWLL